MFDKDQEMKKEKQLYEKVILWKKKPNYPNLIIGCIFCFFAMGMIGLNMYSGESLCSEEQVSGGVLLTMIYSFMIIFSFKMIQKAEGKGRRKYFRKK